MLPSNKLLLTLFERWRKISMQSRGLLQSNEVTLLQRTVRVSLDPCMSPCPIDISGKPGAIAETPQFSRSMGWHCQMLATTIRKHKDASVALLGLLLLPKSLLHSIWDPATDFDILFGCLWLANPAFLFSTHGHLEQ